MEWTWDPTKNDANLRKPQLSFETALLVFDDPLALSVPDPHPFEDRWRTVGVVGDRYLTVVHTDSEDARPVIATRGRIISARKSTRKERQRYDARLP